MFAVIKTGAKQYKVAEGQKIKIEKLDTPQGENVVFNDVLLVDTEKMTRIGQPLVEGARVEGKILEQGRNDKVIIHKYKSKKRFHVTKGHRQPFTMVEITKITG